MLFVEGVCLGVKIIAVGVKKMNCESKRVVAVFAHNEGDNIISCLNSIKAEIRDGDECYVLNNGSTDNTEEVVVEYSEGNTFCKLVSIDVGDKANAWNVFCHRLNISAAVFIFVDGDCVVQPGSFDAFELCFKNNPRANAAAGLPTESSSRKNRRAMLDIGGLAGNLYALSQNFMMRIRDEEVVMPFGLIGDDSLVGSLACWDLNPRGDWDKSRIIMCDGANFSYERLSLFSLSDVKLYLRRKVRYSLRHYQNIMIRAHLKAGEGVMPSNVDELYRGYASMLRLKWRGVDTWFDYIALRKINGVISS